jgi:hypothetical protein
MWILLMVTVTGPISIPGYATREACEAAYKQMYEHLLSGAPVMFFPDVWKDVTCLPAPR